MADPAPKEVSVTAADGVTVPLNLFETAAPRAAVLVMPALGIQAKLYAPLAAALASAGCFVAVLEQRGHGRSPLRARRGSTFGMADFLDRDIPAALDELERRAPGAPLIVGGHSLGGHLATLYAGQAPERVDGVFHVATGAPWPGDFPWPQSLLIRVLCVLVSVCRLYPGYFPGDRLGFAGRESLSLMRNWRRWALTGRLDFEPDGRRAAKVAEWTGPVVSIALERDTYATTAAIDRALAPFTAARITRHTLGPASQGDYLGHFRWARRPDGVAAVLIGWIESVFPGRCDSRKSANQPAGDAPADDAPAER